MQLPQSFHSDPISDELRSLVLNLLEIIEQMRVKDENQQGQLEALKEELRHLKKLKGKPLLPSSILTTSRSVQQKAFSQTGGIKASGTIYRRSSQYSL